MTLSWTNDARQVLFKMGSRIGLLELPGGRQVPLLDHGNDQLWEPELSPDGRWVVFLMVHASDRHSIEVAPFRPGVKPEEWITAVPGRAENDKPRWSPDGRLLYSPPRAMVTAASGHSGLMQTRRRPVHPSLCCTSIAPRVPCPT